MIPLACAISFSLGVLSVVLAGEWERRKKARQRVVIFYDADAFAGYSPRRRAERARLAVDALIPQDSTLPSESK